MATVAEPERATRVEIQGEQRVLLRDISWGLYQTLRDNERNWSARMTYDRGALEIMSPSAKHESGGDFTEPIHRGSCRRPGSGRRYRVLRFDDLEMRKRGTRTGGRRVLLLRPGQDGTFRGDTSG